MVSGVTPTLLLLVIVLEACTPQHDHSGPGSRVVPIERATELQSEEDQREQMLQEQMEDLQKDVKQLQKEVEEHDQSTKSGWWANMVSVGISLLSLLPRLRWLKGLKKWL